MNITQITLTDGRTIRAETMVRDLDVTRGMMFQDSLPEDRGMILIHPADSKHPAFTYNVRIPLDLVWIDKSLHIAEILENVPPCKEPSAKACPIYGGHYNTRYLLELKSGGVRTYGLKVGDSLRF